jgi:molybdopterin-guanine dinucleotide biosynthesis protein A
MKAAPMVEVQVVVVADIREDKAEAPPVATFLEKQGNAVAIFLYLQQVQVPTVLITKTDMPEVATRQMEQAKMGVWY